MDESPSRLEVEPTGDSSGHCDCCGRTSRTIWGYVHEVDGPTLAAYFVRWTDGHLDEPGADLDLVIGSWGDGTASADRATVSLKHRETGDGTPSVMVVDAKPEPSVAGAALTRGEVIGTPLAAQIFAMVDAIYLQDERVFR